MTDQTKITSDEKFLLETWENYRQQVQNVSRDPIVPNGKVFHTEVDYGAWLPNGEGYIVLGKTAVSAAQTVNRLRCELEAEADPTFWHDTDYWWWLEGSEDQPDLLPADELVIRLDGEEDWDRLWDEKVNQEEKAENDRLDALEAEKDRDFSRDYFEEFTSAWRPGKFTIEDAAFFAGFTTGRRWNGWATPAFEESEAVKVLDRFTVKVGDPSWHYNTADDAYIIHEIADPQQSEEVYCGIDITVDGETKHVYAIGAGLWIWDEVQDKQETDPRADLLAAADLFIEELLANGYDKMAEAVEAFKFDAELEDEE